MNLPYFFESVETVPAGVGFNMYDTCHLSWLLAFVLFTVFFSVTYKKASLEKRKKIRILFVILLLLDEAVKTAGLLAIDGYLPKYLPFHLCSINIFIITYHAFKMHKICGIYLYTVSIPAALCALLFPTWTSLPLANYMHLHSFTVHILLAAYPIMLTYAGDIRPEIKAIPHCLALLAALAAVAYVVNLLLGTNFMFLMYPDVGNPLSWFETNWGNHRYGFPVMISGILLVMYLPVYFLEKRRK